MEKPTIAIIGAGVTGLSCARQLKQAGLDPIVFDKGRGIGGRLATRRTDTGLQFDHGAQYMTAKSPEFQSALKDARKAEWVDIWDIGGSDRYVGVPGINGFAKYLADGIEVHQGVEVNAVREFSAGCEIMVDAKTQRFDRLVLTVPAIQAANLIGNEHPFSKPLADVEMLPCLTLMAAFDAQKEAPFKSRRDADDALSWIAHDSTKPGRKTQGCWVAQASPGWSVANLEEAPEEIVHLMLEMLCNRLDLRRSDAIHAVSHRWRYAAVSKPLGEPFLRNDQSSLYLGGDWCLDARVEAAWTSGQKIAADILKQI